MNGKGALFRRYEKMTIKVCDCCGEIIKDYFDFYITYAELHDEKGKQENTCSLEYCKDCFDKLLEKLSLEKR